MPTSGALYAWEFEKAGRELKVHVDGQLTFNGLPRSVQAARLDLGIAFVPDDVVRADVDAGRLVQVLDDWCAPFAGYHLYYPSRRLLTPAFALLIEAVRYRRPTDGSRRAAGAAGVASHRARR